MSFSFRLLLLILISSLGNCQSSSLTELTYEEYKRGIMLNELPELDQLIIRDEFDNRINIDSLMSLHRQNDYFDKFLKNKEGDIVEYRLARKPDFRSLSIDCDNTERLLDSILIIDQSIRNEYDPKQDYANLEVVVNVIERCEMPESPKSIKAIFMVVQHNHSIHQKRYIETFRKASNSGLLPKPSLALMEDRILMNDGKPQLYGTQLSRKNGAEQWQLYELFEPERVNRRRAEMNLGPLEEYLQLYGVEFKVK
jgi:hypothetical protein